MYINLYESFLLLYIHTSTVIDLNTFNSTKVPHVTTFLFPASTLTYSFSPVFFPWLSIYKTLSIQKCVSRRIL